MKGKIEITEAISYIFVEAKGSDVVKVNEIELQPGQSYSKHNPDVPITIEGDDYIYNLD